VDHDFANAVISFAFWRDPERVCEAIAEVFSQLQAEGYSTAEIVTAVEELLDELNGEGRPRH
jgi:hypothetical protein